MGHFQFLTSSCPLSQEVLHIICTQFNEIIAFGSVATQWRPVIDMGKHSLALQWRPFSIFCLEFLRFRVTCVGNDQYGGVCGGGGNNT